MRRLLRTERTVRHASTSRSTSCRSWVRLCKFWVDRPWRKPKLHPFRLGRQTELCPFSGGPPLGLDQRSDFGARLCNVGQPCFRYIKVLDRLEFGGQSPW